MPQKTAKPGSGLAQIYFLFVQFAFLVFLSGVLSFGRPFSILHLNIHSRPLFVTEIMLALGLPVVILKGKYFLDLPRKFLFALIAYFLLGCAYLFSGILSKNLFALRDIVFCVYILFLPLSLGLFYQERSLRFFIWVLIIANIIGMLAAKIIIFEVHPSRAMGLFINEARKFNFGLYCGFAVSFLIAFSGFLRERRARFIALLLLALNLYILIILGVRAAWFALAALFIFYAFLLRVRFWKLILSVVPVFIVLSGISYYVDFKSGMGEKQKEYIISKAVTLKKFSSQKLKSGPSASSLKPQSRPLPKRYSQSYGNLVWRMNIWKQSLEFGMKSPLFGRGFGVYPEYRMPQYKLLGPTKIGVDSNVTPCHNHLLSVFLKMGLLGLALFLTVNIYTFLYALGYLKKCKNEFLKSFLLASLGAFVFWHVVAFFFDVIDSPPTSIFLWVITGLIFAAVRIDRECVKT